MMTDLPSRVAGGFSPAARVGEGWIAVQFETDSLAGTGLATGANSAASGLQLKLGLEGRYQLYLALGSKTALRVWLEGEDGMREVVTQHGGYAALECPLSPADLTGKLLHIEPRCGPAAAPVFLAWIRAVPTADSPSRRRNMVATNDGSSWISLGGLESEREVWKLFEPLRDSDFGLMLWGPGGADWTINHASRIGTMAPCDTRGAFRVYERTAADAFSQLLAGGGDVLRTAVAAARGVGVKIHFYIRPEAFYCPFPHDSTFTSQFFAAHPEFWCSDEFGDVIHRLSYAFQAVQDHMLAYCEELLDYAPDGLCLAFNRSLPMMICEQPVLEEFVRLHGRYPGLPEESDSAAMAAARNSLMTGFLKRVRELLDARNLEFSCIVGQDVRANRIYGLEMLDLAELFDSVMLHNGGLHAPDKSVEFDGYWRDLNRRTPVYPNGWGGSYSHRETAKFLKEEIFEAGFAGGFLWDAENFTENPYDWHVLRRGGTGEFLDGVLSGMIPAPRTVLFTRLQGAKLGRYHPGQSY